MSLKLPLRRSIRKTALAREISKALDARPPKIVAAPELLDLQIHFEALRRKGRLSRPLCQAIDGVRMVPEIDEEQKSFWKFSRAGATFSSRRVNDLAIARWTGGFSGADLAGLVRCSGSLALSRARLDGAGVDNLLITLEDVMLALQEVKR